MVRDEITHIRTERPTAPVPAPDGLTVAYDGESGRVPEYRRSISGSASGARSTQIAPAGHAPLNTGFGRQPSPRMKG
ncbi:hypothetical protein ABZT27_22970 [Streptomyces sp. NPDC005389]|uniref:hypothetical protein n=1 Tax=Streptomyces sp. NPDC005389 TaxID=3157040 RepID=UPI0033A20748